MLADSYRAVKDRITRACERANRDPEQITLVVVTKNHPAPVVLELAKLGVANFGENRDQEAWEKAATVAGAGVKVNWHFIGQLQTNKVKSVLGYASHLHSLDRRSLLEELIKRADSANPLRVFIQLNLTNDPNRGGIAPAELLDFAALVLQAKNLRLLGIMGVAGLGVDPAEDFARLKLASQRLLELAPEATGLSMGMSEDFEAAIEYGATHLRIGSAITGNRPG